MKIKDHKKRILVCPLDWGLGHATRCIPIIKELIELENVEIILAGEKASISILSKEFPELKTIFLKGYNIKYYNKFSISLSLLFQVPKIIWAITSEHFWLRRLIKMEKIDLVISDNRYGLFSSFIPTVFITHQVFIISPFLEKPINKINHWLIKKHAQCWIPDYDGEINLSGKLSHGNNLPASCVYIGPQSRFNQSIENVNSIFDIAVIVSGPETERTRFENFLLTLFKNGGKRIAFFRGLTVERKELKQSNITFFNNCSGQEMNKILLESEIIVSKSGYSTIMDLNAIGKKAILFPTIGQSEQEYLSKYLNEKKIFLKMNQKDPDIDRGLNELRHFSPLKRKNRVICSTLVKALLKID